MPRAKPHPDQATRLRANAEARRESGIIRKSIEVTPDEQASLDAIRAAWQLDSDRAVMRRLIAEAGKKITKARKES
jgi:hypothetical protein